MRNAIWNAVHPLFLWILALHWSCFWMGLQSNTLLTMMGCQQNLVLTSNRCGLCDSARKCWLDLVYSLLYALYQASDIVRTGFNYTTKLVYMERYTKARKGDRNQIVTSTDLTKATSTVVPRCIPHCLITSSVNKLWHSLSAKILQKLEMPKFTKYKIFSEIQVTCIMWNINYTLSQ